MELSLSARGKVRAVLLLCLVTAATPAYAGRADGTTQVAIVDTLSLVSTKDLEFGSITSNGAAGTVIVSPTGVRTATGGAVLAGGVFHAAEFAGRGRRNQQVQITFGAPSISIKRVGGTETMIVDSFTLSSPPSGTLANLGGPTGRYRIMPATGIFDFPVGARLNVGVNQVPGNYEGSFSVTVNYN